jgi:hypothetical protein
MAAIVLNNLKQYPSIAYQSNKATKASKGDKNTISNRTRGRGITLKRPRKILFDGYLIRSEFRIWRCTGFQI